jgi:hypothetical protein
MDVDYSGADQVALTQIVSVVGQAEDSSIPIPAPHQVTVLKQQSVQSFDTEGQAMEVDCPQSHLKDKLQPKEQQTDTSSSSSSSLNLQHQKLTLQLNTHKKILKVH